MHYKADPDAPGAVEKLLEKLLADGMAEDSYDVRSYRAYLKNWPRHAEVEADVEKARASLAVAVRPKAHRFEIVPSRRLRASVFEYLSRPPAEGTVEVPLSWLDGFAPLAADGSAASEVVYSEDVDFCGKVFERDVKLSEPVTGFLELSFGATERECSGTGSVDGHSFDIPKGRESRVVRVGIIREDMLDGKLLLRFESADDAPLRLTSLRVVRK